MGVELEIENACKPDGLTPLKVKILELPVSQLLPQVHSTRLFDLSKYETEEKAGNSQGKIIVLMTFCPFHVVCPLSSMLMLPACC